jgi:hypothetical protein
LKKERYFIKNQELKNSRYAGNDERRYGVYCGEKKGKWGLTS